MAAQRVRVTWEFDIDDSDTAAGLKADLDEVTRAIVDNIAVTPEVRVTRFEWRMPKRPLKVTP